MAGDSVVGVAVKSASYNILLQVLMRIISSLSTAIILRFITKEALGVINVRLMLLYSTCHCFSREAFRRSCLSKFDSKHPDKKFNLLWLIIPTCILCSCILRYIWLHILERPDPDIVPYYSTGVHIVLISVLIEVLAEPVYVFSQSFHFVKLKVFVEGISLIVKSLSMVFFLSKWPQQPMHSFAFSQVLGSFVYTFSYYFYFWWYFKKQPGKSSLPIESVLDMFPKIYKIIHHNFVDWQDLYLTWSFFKQTLLKQLLTEGERYLMTFFSLLSFAEQGLYDVVNNLGSLAARFVFLPIEESGYLLFTQLLTREHPSSTQSLSVSLRILENLLKLLVLLGLMTLTFGYSYSQLLLLLYGGPLLSSGIALILLRWHCVYVLFLAVNGITECFKFAVMNHHQIDRYNKNMLFLSVGFLFATYCLVKLFGSVGFIIANCINMGFRIFHSLNFTRKYFGINWFQLLKKAVPNASVLGILALAFFCTSISETYLCCNYGFHHWIWHLLLGTSFFILFLCVVWCKESVLVKFICEQWGSVKLDVKKEK